MRSTPEEKGRARCVTTRVVGCQKVRELRPRILARKALRLSRVE
jgi:hypothetical protein